MTEQEFLQSVINTSCSIWINRVALVRMLGAVFPGMAIAFTDTGVTLTGNGMTLTASFPAGAKERVSTISGGPDISDANAVRPLDAAGDPIVASKTNGGS
ncbi:hypothetical protein AD929_11705 [Gluconobacter potus]|uniref:Uncharacterized protein n=1 Tax=Gluconobacter potus TaxID=2724927 RepID=A0A149QSJ4_9PROT|nr:hypothetical protein [Gluconobacter potus]KXV00289.1 hypothetical protein AD929_11705 [Gluconobacter potus]